MHLVIIDGHAIAHRAYHSIPSLSFNGQQSCNLCFYSMILSSIDQVKTDYLLVCLDSPSQFSQYRIFRLPPSVNLPIRLSPNYQNCQTLESAGIPNIAMEASRR